MLIVWVLAAVILILSLGLLFFFVPTLGIQSKEQYGPWILGTKGVTIDEDLTKLFMSDNKLLNSSFRVFYYIQSIPRTSTSYSYSEGVAPNFNSKTNTFDICVNNEGTCVHQGFIPLLKFGESLRVELLQAPDASRPGLPKTQLCIQTTQNTGTNNTVYLETFSLPPFPVQKWTMLTIVRNGNKFDTYYNDTLVASHKTTYTPYFTSTSGSFGDAGLRGEVKYAQSKSSASLSTDVVKDYLTLADSRGEPKSPLFESISLSFCPSGDCFRGPQVRPANPLIDWRTNYM